MADDVTQDYVVATTATWWKVAVWIIPVVFGAGGLHATVTTSGSQATQAVQTATQVGERLHGHEKAIDAHPALTERLGSIQTEQRTLMTEQRRSSENIAAICQATKANCR